MPPVIPPTIGRALLFWPARALAERKPDQPFSARIAYVHSDGMVNIEYIDANGHSNGSTSVPLIQAGEPAPAMGYYCEWMPYQHGQAAKTEAAEASALELGAAARAAERGFTKVPIPPD
jgi:hypothetical protein